MRDPSKSQEIIVKLQRDDPALFQELVAYIQATVLSCQEFARLNTIFLVFL